MKNDLVHLIRLVVEEVMSEELSQGEINHLSSGAMLINSDLDQVEVADVSYDEDGSVVSVDVIRYRVDSSNPDAEPVAYRQTVTAKELKDYEVA